MVEPVVPLGLSLSGQLKIYAKTLNMLQAAADAVRCHICCDGFHVRVDAKQDGSAKNERYFAASD